MASDDQEARRRRDAMIVNEASAQIHDREARGLEEAAARAADEATKENLLIHARAARELAADIRARGEAIHLSEDSRTDSSG
jgi:hypothetical protein